MPARMHGVCVISSREESDRRLSKKTTAIETAEEHAWVRVYVRTSGVRDVAIGFAGRGGERGRGEREEEGKWGGWR